MRNLQDDLKDSAENIYVKEALAFNLVSPNNYCINNHFDLCNGNFCDISLSTVPENFKNF